jgi:hypothetical protein
MVMKLTGFKVKNPWLQPMGKSPASVLPDNSPLIPPVVRRGRDLVLTKEGKTDCGGSVFPKHNQILICPLLDAFGVGSDVNYRQTFCRKHEALTKGSPGLLTALLVIK